MPTTACLLITAAAATRPRTKHPHQTRAQTSGEAAAAAAAAAAAGGGVDGDGDDDGSGEPNTIYVKNLAWATEEGALRRAFERAGAIRAVAIPRKKASNSSAAAAMNGDFRVMKRDLIYME
jgi:RNA recognition motif. (a.k.a. RRM, RBD, or RNP domain)